MDHLYRFRSTRALLDDYNELEAEEIFFCSPDMLNDPMEGFKDIFWRGDYIVWRNFLRHYLLNLLQANLQVGRLGLDFKSDDCAVFVHMTDEDLPETPTKAAYVNICQDFFQHPAVERLLIAFSSKNRIVRRHELLFYLGIFHPLAISKIAAEMKKHDVEILKSNANLDSIIDGMDRNVEKVLKAHDQSLRNLDEFYAICESNKNQIDLIHDFSNPISDNFRGAIFIARDFPSFYVNALERLLYPDWHVACFVADPTNTSMWGGYADSHKGVCLKFKTKIDAQGAPTLDLYRIVSWSGSKNQGSTQNYGFAAHKFNEVTYEKEFPEFDFFESMGALPMGKLKNFWFSGEKGERSSTAARLLAEDPNWREEYWDRFNDSFTIKTSEWRHEKEHRLILHSNLQRFDDPVSRKLKYRFEDLSGIVFGIKTTAQDKLRIMKIIEKKCNEVGRKDFEFYQASYSRRTKSIELILLRLINIK